MRIIPYLFFPGTAEQAIDTYSRVLDGKVAVMQRFSDGPPDMQIPPGMEDKVMHARLEYSGGMLYFSDGHGVPEGSTHSLTIEFDDLDSLASAYELLSDGGKVHFELQDMFWGARYGKLTDKYGINWDLNYQYPEHRGS